MNLSFPRWSALVMLVAVGALVAGCAEPQESGPGADESPGDANETGSDANETEPGEPTLPAFDPSPGNATLP